MRLLFAFAASVCFVSSLAYGAAWTQSKGKGIAILGVSYYSAGKYYDNNGQKQSQPDYTKYELNPYFEYGITDSITAGANILLDRAHQDAASGNIAQSNWGIGDSEFFIRARVWQKNGFVVSVEPLVKLPSPDSANDAPRLGGSHPDVALGISAGYGFEYAGRHHFIDVGAQYRYRFGAPEDQIRFSATAGIGITERLMLLPQIFATYRTESPTTASFTQSAADDYNLVTLQLSALYKIDDDISVQLGAFHHADGKNTGAGSAALLSVWKRF